MTSSRGDRAIQGQRCQGVRTLTSIRASAGCPSAPCAINWLRHADAGVPPHLLVDRQLDARFAGHRDQPGGGRVVGGERLLAEEMFAGRRRSLRDRHLRLRRDGNVDDLHLVIRQQVVEGGGNPRDAVVRRGSFRRRQVAVVAGDDAEAAGLVGRQVGVVDDTATADDPDPPVAADRERDRVVDLIPGPRFMERRFAAMAGRKAAAITRHLEPTSAPITLIAACRRSAPAPRAGSPRSMRRP